MLLLVGSDHVDVVSAARAVVCYGDIYNKSIILREWQCFEICSAFALLT